ncbi:hypothetical protein ACOMHN_054052 [Nucella lapillus]
MRRHDTEAKLKMKQYADSKAYVKPADYTIPGPAEDFRCCQLLDTIPPNIAPRHYTTQHCRPLLDTIQLNTAACSSTPYHPAPMTQSC